MNKIILMGRLTGDPVIKYSSGEPPIAIARFSLAVDRRFRRAGEHTEADFFSCTAFGKQAEFVEKYLKKGVKILISGRVQNNNYTNREGQKVYGIAVIIEEMEFCESKASAQGQRDAQQAPQETPVGSNGFMHIPDEMDDADLPFN